MFMLEMFVYVAIRADNSRLNLMLNCIPYFYAPENGRGGALRSAFVRASVCASVRASVRPNFVSAPYLKEYKGY